MKCNGSADLSTGLPLRKKRRPFALPILWASVAALALMHPAHAAPEGGQVSAGQADIVQAEKLTTITQQSDRAIIDWRGFDLAADETARFVQPSSAAVTLNRVNAASPSQIAGRLEANGNIIIINPNGVFFTPTATVDVGGLVASTADSDNARFMAGEIKLDRAGAPNAKIAYAGQITVRDAGLVGLVAPEVENSGTITAQLGKVALAAGDTATIDLYGDGLIEVGVSQSTHVKATNTGSLHAGQIEMTAAQGRALVDQLVSAGGEIHATHAVLKNGRIILSAPGGKTQVSGKLRAPQIDVLGAHVKLTSAALLDASGLEMGGRIRVGGDYQGISTDIYNAQLTEIDTGALIRADAQTQGNGGRVIIWADGTTRFSGSIRAQGGAQSGDGGFVEVSGKRYLLFKGQVDTTATHGIGGLLLLDPADIVIANGSGDGAADGTTTFRGAPSNTVGTVTGPDTGPTTIYESELEGLAATTSIAITATNSITVNNLADDTLNMAQTAGRTVSFTAGAGGFVMQDTNDTLRTNGGALNITTSAGGGAALGSINTVSGLTTLNLAGTGTVQGTISGSGGLTKSGTGTLTLSTANSYSGPTTLSAGVLSLAADGALGTGTLVLNGGTLNGAGGARSLSNALSLAANSTLAGAADLSFSGLFTHTRAGNTTLTISNTGQTIFNNINLSNSGSNRTVTISNTGGNVTVGGVIANGGSSTGSSFSKSGAGTLILNGASSFAGTMTLSAGTLQLGNAAALGAGTFALAGGTVQGNGTAHTLANAISFSAAATIAGSSALTFTNTLTSSNSLTLTNNNTALTTFGNINLSNSGTSRTLTIGGAGNTTVSGNILNGGGSTGSALSKTGTGTLTLNGTNNYGGTTTLNGGSLIIAGTNSGAGATTLTSGTLRLSAASALASGNLNLNGGVLQLAADTGTNFLRNVVMGGSATIQSDRLTSGAGVTHTLGNLTQANTTLTISAGSNVSSGTAGVQLGTATYSNNPIYNVGTNAQLQLGALSNGGTNRAVTKNGAGTLVLGTTAGTWATTGNSLAIANGTVRLGANNALGTGGNTAITVNANVAGATALFDLNGFNQTITTLTFGGTGGTATSTSNVSTGAGTLTLGGNVTFTNTGNPLGSTLSGNLSLGTATRTFTINDSTGATRDLVVSANISGTGGLTKAGTGTLVLSGNNTYSGTTTLNATSGILRAETATSLGAGSLTIAGSVLQLAGDSDLNFGRNTTLSATAQITTDRLTSGAGVTHTLGTLALGGFALTTAAGTNISSGTAGLTFGATTLSGNSTFATGTNTQLSLGALNNGGTNRTPIKNGAGTLVLSAAAGTWATTGNTLTINNGSLRLGASNALGAAGNTAVTVNSTSAGTTTLFDLNGFNQTVVSLTYGGTGGTASNNQVSTGSGTLTLAGNVTLTSTGNPLSNTLSGNLALGAATRTFTVADSTGTTRDLIVSANISGTGGLTKAGAGTLVLTGNNSYSGTTTLNATSGILRAETATALGSGNLALAGSVLQLAGDSNLSFGRNTTISGSTTITTDRLTAGAAVTHTLGTLSQGALTLTTAQGSNITSGTSSLVFGSTTISGNATFSTNANTQLQLGALSNGGTNRALIKSGAGTWILGSAAGTWATTGNTLAVNNGTVRLGASNALGAGSNTAVTVNATTAGATALLDLNGFNQTVASLTYGGTGGTATSTNNVSTGAGMLTLGGNVTYTSTGNPLGSTLSGNLALGGNRTFTINNSTSTTNELTVSAVISGANNIIKAGAGRMVLSGANTYSGSTTVSTGTLALGAANRIANSSALNISAGAVFDFAGFDETLASITATGDVTLGAGATITTSGAQTYTGAVSGGAATLVSSGGGAITAANALNNWTGALAISTTGAVSVADANDLELGSVSGSTILARALGGNLLTTGLISASATSGTALTLTASANYINSAGASALSTGSGGRWLVYSNSAATDSTGGLNIPMRRYGCVYGGACPTLPATGNGFVHAATPTLVATPAGLTITAGAAVPDLSAYAYTLTGYFADDASLDSLSGSLTGNTNYSQLSPPGSYTIDYLSGALTSTFGYAVTYANNAAGIIASRSRLLTTELPATLLSVLGRGFEFTEPWGGTSYTHYNDCTAADDQQRAECI
jgi:filamentous hemagglutinin family protein